jgi:hypothetical protein
VQRKVPDSFLRVTDGKPKGIVLLRMRSSVVNSGFVRAEEGAQQLLEGNWENAEGHRCHGEPRSQHSLSVTDENR